MPPRQGIEPHRRCVACRTTRPKRELIRVARARDGSVRVDVAATAPGRGAYVCRRVECVDAATRRGALARALGGGPAAADAIRLGLEDAVGGNET